MKTKLLLVATLGFSSAFAATPFERELAQLKDQRDKAVAAAVEPINRRYQASLEQLLRRATQASDLEAAVKIKAELTGGGGVGESPSGFATSPRTVQKTLTGQWNWVGTNHRTWGAFVDDGTYRQDGVTFEVKVSSTGVVTVTRPDKAKATFRLASDLQSFTGTSFDGQPLSGSRRN